MCYLYVQIIAIVDSPASSRSPDSIDTCAYPRWLCRLQRCRAETQQRAEEREKEHSLELEHYASRVAKVTRELDDTCARLTAADARLSIERDAVHRLEGSLEEARLTINTLKRTLSDNTHTYEQDVNRLKTDLARVVEDSTASYHDLSHELAAAQQAKQVLLEVVDELKLNDSAMRAQLSTLGSEREQERERFEQAVQESCQQLQEATDRQALEHRRVVIGLERKLAAEQAKKRTCSAELDRQEERMAVLEKELTAAGHQLTRSRAQVAARQQAEERERGAVAAVLLNESAGHASRLPPAPLRMPRGIRGVVQPSRADLSSSLSLSSRLPSHSHATARREESGVVAQVHSELMASLHSRSSELRDRNSNNSSSSLGTTGVGSENRMFRRDEGSVSLVNLSHVHHANDCSTGPTGTAHHLSSYQSQLTRSNVLKHDERQTRDRDRSTKLSGANGEAGAGNGTVVLTGRLKDIQERFKQLKSRK